MTKSISFHVSREYVRKISFVDPDGKRFTIHHVYPTLADFVGGSIPDKVNPRTHGEECLKGKLPAHIKKTIEETPHDFVLANRGSTILNSDLHYDENAETMTLTFDKYQEPNAIHGVADGATTVAVISDSQTELLERAIKDGGGIAELKTFCDLARYPELVSEDVASDLAGLKQARIHLEIITGINERDRIACLSEGRNTSRQVKPWTMADFNGDFDFLKKILKKQLC